jgi:pilus assembly protein CpaC
MKPRAALLLTAALACLAAPAEAKGGRSAEADAGAQPVSAEEINLAVGETHTMSARGVRNFSEGVPGVIEVKLTSDQSQFVLTARKPGTTSLLLIRNDGSQQTHTIHVFARAPATVEKEIRQLLDGLPNVRLRRIGARQVIDGEVRNAAEKTRVDHLAQLYPGQVDSMVSIASALPADDDAVANKYLVRIDFYFVQMDVSSGYAVGLGWPRSIGGPNAIRATGTFDLLSQNVSQGAITVNQPLPQLDLAASNGWGKVLKHATVITSSGAEAKFQSGGEQNFSVNTGLSATLQRIPFGVDVTIAPQFDPARRELRLHLSADVSDLTPAGPGTTVPGRQTSSLTTQVTMKLGQSLVLSGVRSRSQQHAVTGIPILSKIPVLGVLFGSHADSTSETEGAIYIVPNVIENVRSSSMELIDGAVKKFSDFNGNIEKAQLYEHRPSKVVR